MSGAFELALWALLVLATLSDLLWGKIHNVLTFAFLGTGLVCRFWAGGISGGSEALVTVSLAFALFFPLWRLGAMAAGDVKLLMAVGAFTTPRFLLTFSAIAILVGAAVGAYVLLRQVGLRTSFNRLHDHLKNRAQISARMPFAPAFFCALLLVKIAEMYRWNLL